MENYVQIIDIFFSVFKTTPFGSDYYTKSSSRIGPDTTYSSLPALKMLSSLRTNSNMKHIYYLKVLFPSSNYQKHSQDNYLGFTACELCSKYSLKRCHKHLIHFRPANLLICLKFGNLIRFKKAYQYILLKPRSEKSHSLAFLKNLPNGFRKILSLTKLRKLYKNFKLIKVQSRCTSNLVCT